MKNTFFGLALSLLVLLMLGLNIGAQTTKVSVTWYQAKERAYKEAAEAAAARLGCKSIPFSSAKRCQTVYNEMKRSCDTKRSCSDQAQPLKIAIKSGNRAKISEIRAVCVARIELNEICLAGREKVQDFYRNAKVQVEEDLRDFQAKAKSAKGGDKAMFESLIRYAEDILLHYRETEDSHMVEITKAEEARSDCREEVTKADGAIK